MDEDREESDEGGEASDVSMGDSDLELKAGVDSFVESSPCGSISWTYGDPSIGNVFDTSISSI